MENIIILVIVAAVLVIAGIGSVKHFRGESSCCGGTSAKVKKKKLKKKVIKTEKFLVEGMKCGNCANTVTRVINDIDGASAIVNLNKKAVFVSYDRDVDSEVIKKAIERAGYSVIISE